LGPPYGRPPFYISGPLGFSKDIRNWVNNSQNVPPGVPHKGAVTSKSILELKEAPPRMATSLSYDLLLNNYLLNLLGPSFKRIKIPPQPPL